MNKEAQHMLVSSCPGSSSNGFGGKSFSQEVAQQSLVLPAHVANRTLPKWLLPNLLADEFRSCSRPDAICILPYGNNALGRQSGHQRDIQAMHPSRWDLHLIEVNYCNDTRPEQQLA